MQISEVDCPVCSKNDYQVVFPDTLGKKPPVFGYKWTPDIRKSYRIVVCNDCEHRYCSPRLIDMYKYYEDVSDDGYLDNKSLRINTAKKVIDKIRKFKSKGTLLDIGCSTGDFLTVANKFYNVEGIELSEWAAEIAKKQGLIVHNQTMAKMAQTHQGTYDIITMWGVIEHLEHPLTEIKNINTLLKPGGLVSMWTGDYKSIFSKLLGYKWWYILGQHIQYFSRDSMDKLMEKSGFKQIYMGNYPYVISLDYLGTSLSRYPVVGTLANKILKLPVFKNAKITLKLSSEIFAIYQKK